MHFEASKMMIFIREIVLDLEGVKTQKFSPAARYKLESK